MAKIPTILEAGRADGKLVTSDAIFDENKEMFQSEINDIQDTLNSDNPNKPLSAKQGKILKDFLDSKVIEAGSVPIDTEPIEGNITHLVNSDGLAKEFKKHNTAIIKGSVYDVSFYNNGAVFDSIQSLLSSPNLSTLIPASVRHGGMSIRFIQGSKQSSNNKYVLYRLMSDTFSTIESDWQGVDDVPTAGSNNLIESGGVKVVLDNINQNWEFAKYDMAGNYTITLVKDKINIKKGYTYKIVVSEISNTNTWLQLRDNGNTKNLIQLVLPADTEKEFTADDDYPNAFLIANCESNNSKVVGSIIGDKSINVIDSLESNNKSDPLSANQGKILASYITAFVASYKGNVSIKFNTDTYKYDITIDNDVQIRFIYKNNLAVKGIPKGTLYELLPQRSLVIDARDNEIQTIISDDLKPYHILLCHVPDYEDNYQRCLFGIFTSDIRNLTSKQQREKRLLINAQENLGNIVTAVYGTGFINNYQYSSGNIKITIAEKAVIYYFLVDGSSNSVAIDVGTEYIIPPHYALVIDSIDNTIKQKSISSITLGDVVLLQTGEVDNNWTRYITGFFSNRILIATSYEDYNLHNVKQQYVRNVDDKSEEVLNESIDFSILIGTDLHTNTQGVIQSTPELNVLMRIDKNLNPDIIVNLGDTVALGLENPNRAYYSLNDIKQSTHYIQNYYYVVGNHDYNNISDVTIDRQPKDSIIPHKTIYNILGKLHENDVVWGSKESMYYYKDFNEKKIRVIFLNTLDKPEEWVTVDGVEYEKYPWLPNIVSSNQIDWLIDTALNFSDKGEDKTNWSVIVCSHVSPAPNILGNEASLGSLQNDNPQGVEICKIMEAFAFGISKTLLYVDEIYEGNASINRNADFTNQGAINVIGWFSGHTHHDNLSTINGITYITTLCGYYSSGVDSNYITMTPNTYTEFALDLLIVDKVNRTAKLKRYGAGDDRTWSY